MARWSQFHYAPETKAVWRQYEPGVGFEGAAQVSDSMSSLVSDYDGNLMALMSDRDFGGDGDLLALMAPSDGGTPELMAVRYVPDVTQDVTEGQLGTPEFCNWVFDTFGTRSFGLSEANAPGRLASELSDVRGFELVDGATLDPDRIGPDPDLMSRIL